MSITRIQLPHSDHALPAGSQVLRKTNPRNRLEVTVGLKRAKPLPSLSALDDTPPQKRVYATRDQLASDFGPDPASVQTVEQFANQFHLVVVKTDRTSSRMTLAGTVADMSEAFGVTLFDYSQPELGEFHARTGPLYVPPQLASAVTGVVGFNNHRILRRKLRQHRTAGSSERSWFYPTELATAYNFPAAPANPKTCIGILEFGGGVVAADVTKFLADEGKALGIAIAPPNIQIVSVDGVGSDAAVDPDTTGEVMLDVEVAGSMLPGAKLAVYFSNFDERGLVDCLSAVLADSANDPAVVSISYGWAENQPFNSTGILWSATAIALCDESFLALANLGITVCVSTGDDGSEAQVKDGRAHVNYPAISPYVLAVGGTTLHRITGANGIVQNTEVVWNDGPGSGGGGGVSDITPTPSWQTGKVPNSINPGGFAGRAIPDVAANADPATGYFTVVEGKPQLVGGTSASAPLWAGLIARINESLGSRVGNFNALLYSQIGPNKVLNDITVGNNDTDGLLDGQFPAGTGWDACTGWGTPNGVALLNAFMNLGAAPPPTPASSTP